MKTIKLGQRGGRHAEAAFVGLAPMASKHLMNLANRTRNNAVVMIQRGDRSGREYVRGGKKQRRSAPGEPPKTDTGTLASNIFADKVGSDAVTGVPRRPRIPGATAGNARREMGYAADLEYRMNRPYIAPAANAAIEQIDPDWRMFRMRNR